MAVVGIILFVLVLLAGIAMALFGLPGTIVILLDALVYGWATGWSRISLGRLLLLMGLCLIAEIADNLLTVIGSRKYGTSTRGQWAGLLGAVVGAMILGAVSGPLPAALGLATGPLGGLLLTLLAPLAGAFLGAYAAVYAIERYTQAKSASDACRAAWGAIVGRALGSLLKLAIAVTMAGLCLYAAFHGLAG